MAFLWIIPLIIAGAFGYRYWSKRQTRQALLATPLSDEQRALVAHYVPMIKRLPHDLRSTLEGKVSLFLHQIEFIGCDGLEVTEEMRLSIATQACLLVVNTDTWYDHLYTILIYPGAFKSLRQERSGYVVTERETVRLGESWSRGPVILSWAHAVQGALNDQDGHNVVLHEFAHQVDDLSGHTDGAPILSKGQSFADWARVFTQSYEAHVQDVQHGRPTLFDAYGATGQEEFFAVAVEVFFERPAEVRRAAPEVYDQLTELFQLDPADWT